MLELAEAFQTLCGALPEPTLLVTPHAGIVGANRAACDLLQSTVEEIQGRDFTEVCADTRESIVGFLRRAGGSRELVPWLTRVRTRTGESIPCALMGASAGLEDAGVPPLILLRLAPKHEERVPSADLHERVEQLNAELAVRDQTEAQLHEHREWLRTTLSSIGDGVLVTDREGRVNFMNPIAESLTGWNHREAEGQSLERVFTIVNETSREVVKNPIALALSEEVVVALADHTVLISKDGTERPIDDSAAPIRDDNGELIGAVLVFRDMTERRRHDLDLEMSHHRLQQMNESLKQFAYAAAHDLKEPLRSVSIYSELLSRRYGGQLDEKANEFLAFVRGGARRMQALVDDLFRFTEAADTLELPLENVDCNDVMRTVAENLAVLIGQTGAAITFDSLPVVSAHASPLIQVFQNLIENAIKYRRPDERPTIEIGAEPLKGYWRFSVRDNGIGIPKDYHRLIFGVFKRLSHQTPGSGIGLAICNRVIERYGGRIWLESEIGAGSTFFFTLPAAARADATRAAGG